MAQHTPAPWWRSHETSDGFYIYAIVNGKPTVIGKTISTVDERVERENARVMAAGAVLLEACRQALARIESDIESPGRTVREGDLCREALGKASPAE